MFWETRQRFGRDRQRRRTSGVEGELLDEIRYRRLRFRIPGNGCGVDEHVGAAGVQDCHQRIEARIAEIDSVVRGQQHDTVEVQCVQSIFGFGDRRGDVGHGQHRERTESCGVLLEQIRGIGVAVAGQVVGFPAA